jgi:hypothetical protein
VKLTLNSGRILRKGIRGKGTVHWRVIDFKREKESFVMFSAVDSQYV